VAEDDVQVFGERAYEEALYLVKAVMLKSPGGQVQSAADRIDTLLEGALLIVPGYTPMVSMRESRVRFTEVDDLDDSVRWSHAGGQYRIVMST